MTIDRIQNLANRQFGKVRKMVNKVPKLRRGKVWCHSCGKKQEVDSAECMKSGWTECCEETMSIDSPEERASLGRSLK